MSTIVKQWARLNDSIFEVETEIREARERKENYVKELKKVEGELKKLVGRNQRVKLYLLPDGTALQVRWINDNETVAERFTIVETVT